MFSEEVPHHTRVIVTEHNSFGSIFNNRTLGYLNAKYPHFFYHEKFTEVKGSSQYLLSMVDAVVGGYVISSSSSSSFR